MLRYLMCTLLFVSSVAHAATSLRVGSKVLTVGDSAVKLKKLMGEPSLRILLKSTTGGMPRDQMLPGEQWQYVQESKTIVVTVINGKVAKFETLYD
jgi:hypothetical protein